MTLIICPECQKKVSSEADVCVHCGYPIKQNKKNNIHSQLFKVVLFKVGDSPVTCMRCLCENLNITLAESKKYIDDLHYAPKIVIDSISKNKADEIARQLIEEGCTVKVLNNDEQVEYNSHSRPETIISNSTPKCPTCGSTNIKKISSTAKVTNTVLFGIFGNKRKKQFHCESCGYEW